MDRTVTAATSTVEATVTRTAGHVDCLGLLEQQGVSGTLPEIRSTIAGLHASFDIVVVDNGSTDGSQAMLSREFPDVILVQNDHNVGLGKASNQGIEATRGRHVLLLNNDTIVNGLSLDAMVEFLDAHPDVGAVGGKTDQSGRLVSGRLCQFLDADTKNS